MHRVPAFVSRQTSFKSEGSTHVTPMNYLGGSELTKTELSGEDDLEEFGVVHLQSIKSLVWTW